MVGVLAQKWIKKLKEKLKKNTQKIKPFLRKIFW